MKTGAQYKSEMDAAHNKAMAMQKANTPVPMMSEAKDDAMDKKAGIKDGSKRDIALDKKRGLPADTVKKTGTFHGKSNKLGHGGRAAQLKAKGVPGGVIGNLARAAGAAKGGPNYHGK